jgi:lysophospholipase L1-like esterase
MFKHLKIYLVCLLTCLSMDFSSQPLSQNTPLRFLALGDSYTIGESVAEVQRWPAQLAEALRKRGIACRNPDIIAVTGWRTDDLKKAIDASSFTKNYDLVSLLIGVNNQYQGKSVEDYSKEFEDLLNTAIGYAGGDASKVFVLSIPDYGFTPFGFPRQPQISLQIDTFNSVNKHITKGKGVAYIDITDISRLGLKEPALVAGDGLHPSGKMYRLWVNRILDVFFSQAGR